MSDGLEEMGLPPLRGPGDNNPPEPTALERAEELIPACDEWTAKGALTSEDEARLLSEFLVQIRKARTAVQAERDAATKPLEEALTAIKFRFNYPMAKLDIAIERIAGSKKVKGLLAEWMSKEKQRIEAAAEVKKREAADAARVAETMKDRAATTGTIDAELEARRAIEQADELQAEAERKPERVRVKGDLAPKAVALHDYWWAEIVNWKLAGQHYKKEPKVLKGFRDAVEKCASDDARRLKDASKAPPGVVFHKREQAQ